MSTDTRFIVDQFRLTNRISSLGVMQTTNPLLPETYSRVQVPFLKQNRRENFQVAYGDSNKTYTFPESLGPGEFLLEVHAPSQWFREL